MLCLYAAVFLLVHLMGKGKGTVVFWQAVLTAY